MQRIIITGPNGAGKSHLASRFHHARPDVPHVSFDAIKLTTGWQERPRAQIDARLSNVVQTDAWILDGGPSLLQLAVTRADAVIWLDPPLALRAWRLFSRPFKGLGRTRAELPSGNPDRVVPQFHFAWRSLRRDAIFRASIAKALSDVTVPVLACYTRVDVDGAVSLWRKSSD